MFFFIETKRGSLVQKNRANAFATMVHDLVQCHHHAREKKKEEWETPAEFQSSPP